MPQRNEYYLDLTKLDTSSSPTTDAGLQLSAAAQTDVAALAKLMIEAYRDTIDYDGEIIEDAISEIEAYLAGQRGGQPLLNESRLCFIEDQLAAACLAAQWACPEPVEWDEKQYPFIAYVMTRAGYKNRGLGKQLVRLVLQELAGQGYSKVYAVITEGNTPSERLFTRLGFERV